MAAAQARTGTDEARRREDEELINNHAARLVTTIEDILARRPWRKTS
jgi:hypothetical protein